MSLITHNNIQKWPSCLIIFSTNNMACCMLMGTCTYRRSLHAESTKYIIRRRPIPPLSDFCQIWICSPIPNHHYQTPTFPDITFPTYFGIVAISTVSSAALDNAVALLCMSSAASKSPCWEYLNRLIMGAEMRRRAKRPRYEGREWTPSKSTRTCQNRWTEPSIDGR